MRIRVVSGEVSDATAVTEDSSDSSNVNDPSSVSRSSSLDSSNPRGNRGERVEMGGVISRSFDIKGLDCGVSSHGEHMGAMV